MENYSASYKDEMHARYLELVSTDNPYAKPRSQWARKDWQVYDHEQANKYKQSIKENMAEDNEE